MIISVLLHLVKRGLDERLTTTQVLLQQQEDAVRRGDRERRALSERVKELERLLQASETDKRHTQVHRLLCLDFIQSLSQRGMLTVLRSPYGSRRQ